MNGGGSGGGARPVSPLATGAAAAATAVAVASLLPGADAGASASSHATGFVSLSDAPPPLLTKEFLEREDEEADADGRAPSGSGGSAGGAAGAGAEGPYASLPRSKRREAVRKEFLHGWRGYEAYAWGKDELHLLSKRGDGGTVFVGDFFIYLFIFIFPPL